VKSSHSDGLEFEVGGVSESYGERSSNNLRHQESFLEDLTDLNDKEANEIGKREGIQHNSVLVEDTSGPWSEQESDTGVGRYVRNTLMEMSLTIAKARQSTRL